MNYLSLADIADICGVQPYVLINHFFPAEWAVPRNWRLVPRSSTVLVAEDSVPDLIVALCESGEVEGAEKLAHWLDEMGPDVPHEIFMAQHSATPAARAVPWWKKGQFE